MCFYSISVYDYLLLTTRISRRSTVIDKRRFQVRLFSASTYALRPHALRLLPLLLPVAAALLRALLVHLDL